MIKGHKILGVIPARGGSKGVPGKNIREVAGRPLLAWTIEEAKKSRYLDRLILSSDDLEIIEVARKWGCEVPFVRPAELAQDHIPGSEAILHAVEKLPGYDYVVVLQPTSPLRRAEDIDGCIEKCLQGDEEACVSVVEPETSPFWMYVLDEGDLLRPLIPSRFETKQRQFLPKVYVPNGAVYVVRCDVLVAKRSLIAERTIGFEMTRERSLDVDTEMDLVLLEFELRRQGGKGPRQGIG